MKKNAKVGLILGVGALVAAISYYFLIYKPSKASTTGAAPATGGNTSNGNTTGGAATTAPASLVGKHVYAKKDGIKEVYSNGQIKRIINKDAWVGLVYEEVTLSANPFYRVGTNTYVAKSLVYAK